MTSTSEALPRKKKIRAGHRASETRLLNQIDAILGDTHPDSDRLALLKLKEKLETLKLLVSEIVELTPEEGLVKEIEQADEYKENVYRALTGIDKFHAATSAPASPLGRVTASHGQQGQIDKDKSRQTAMSLITGAIFSPLSCLLLLSKLSTLRLSAPQFPVLAHVDKSSEPVGAVSTALERDTSVVIAGRLTGAASARRSTIPVSAKNCFQISGILLQPNLALFNKPILPSSQLNRDAPPYVGTPTTSTLCSDDRKMILLRTARAHIHNPSDPHRTLEVRLLLDGGSQRSYITDRVRKFLAL